MPDADASHAEFARLVASAKSGDSEALSEVIRQIEPVVRAYFIRRLSSSHASIDDLVQNTLLRVYRGISDLKDADRLKAFALKAALFELQDLFRGRYSARELAWSSETGDPAVRPLSEGLRIDIERALSTLTPEAQRIIELKVLGYRYKEIAGMIDSTEAAVKMQVKRSLERLRGLLGAAAWWMLLCAVQGGPS